MVTKLNSAAKSVEFAARTTYSMNIYLHMLVLLAALEMQLVEFTYRSLGFSIAIPGMALVLQM